MCLFTTLNIVGYTDSNWAGDRYDCKSQGGYIFKMARTPILWKLKKQTIIARLTTEAEYLVACSQATWDTQELIYQYWEVTSETMVPLIDWNSNGVLSTICSTITSDKAKHIDVPFHNSWHLDTAGVVKFTEINTRKNLADFTMKTLTSEQHQYLTHGIGLHSFRKTALLHAWYQPTLTVFMRSQYQLMLTHTQDRLLALAPAQPVPTFAQFRYRWLDKSLSFFIGSIGSMSLSFSCCTVLFFLLQVTPTEFTAEVLIRLLELYISDFHPLWHFIMSFGLACMPATMEHRKWGSVAISHLFCFVTLLS